MGNIFYNIVCIFIGTILMPFGIITIIKKNGLVLGILSIIHSVLFLFFGIYGFFLPEEYEVISVLAMLAFTLTMIITFLLTKKKKSA